MTTLSAAAVAISEAAHAGDEIVVGATGHSSFMDGLLGSVTTGVVHRSHVPVIVVSAKPVAAAGATMRKIVIGLDGCARAQMQLDAMEQLKTALESLGVLLSTGPIHVHPRLVEKSQWTLCWTRPRTRTSS